MNFLGKQLVQSVEFQIGDVTVQTSIPCRNPQCTQWMTYEGKAHEEYLQIWRELSDVPIETDICSWKCFCALIEQDGMLLNLIKIKPLQTIILGYLLL